MMMKTLRLAFLSSSLAAYGCAAVGVPNGSTASAGVTSRSDVTTVRTFMTVEYDYKLETNATSNDAVDSSTFDAQPDNNIFGTIDTPLQDALLDIDSNIVASLQERIPNGFIPEGKTQPDVEFDSVTSRFINMCFTTSDACKWVKSRIKLSFVGDRPKSAMERVTLNLVQAYMQDISDSSPSVNAEFVYPMIHSPTVQFEFSPVDGPMNDGDIQDLEEGFYNVYHALVEAKDGDTEISEAHFVYQAHNEEEKTVLVNIKYYAKCRYCTKDELTDDINAEIEPNQRTLLWHLQKDLLNEYFQQVDVISFEGRPRPPAELPPINESINDAEAPKATESIAWFLYSGGFVAVFVLAGGIWVIFKDQKELRKTEAEATTDGETSSDDEKEKAETDEEEPKGDSSLDTNSVNNKNGMHSDYEVYVY